MTKKIAVIILCRYNSSRLPGKILMEIKGNPILLYIVQRLQNVFSLNEILVATSSHPSDQPIVKFCTNSSIQVFTGELENVANRFLKAAESVSAEYAIRINGDNLFVDVSLLNEFKSVIEASDFDFVSNVKDRTYPKGMSIEAVRVAYFKTCYNLFNTSGHFEHVTSYLYENPPDNSYYFYNKSLPEAAGIQLAIDTSSDFEMANKIFLQMEKDQRHYQMEDIYNLYKKINNESI